MSIGEIAAYVLSAILILVLCRIFFKPLKIVLALVLQSALGGAGLYFCNFLLSPLGLSVGVNIVTACLCGMFGIPGLITAIVVKSIYTYL